MKDKLNRHIASVHENVRFKCDFCEKEYKRKDLLNGHLSTKHWDQIENDIF